MWQTHDWIVFSTRTNPPWTIYHSLNGRLYIYWGMKAYFGIPTVGNIACCQKLAPPFIAVNAYTAIKIKIPSTGPEIRPRVRVLVWYSSQV